MGGVTARSTGGGSYLIGELVGVAQLGDGLGLGFTTGRASEGLYALGFLGRFYGDCTLVPAVALGGGFDVSIAVAAGAGMGGMAARSTGGGSYLIGVLVGVAQFGDGLGLGFTTGRAGEGLYALGFLGRFFGDCALVPTVALGGGFAVSIAVAAGAGMGGVALLGAGGSRYGIGVLVDMILGRDDLCFRLFAGGTGEQLFTLSRFGGFFRHLAAVPVVALGGNRLLLYGNSVADRAVLALSQASFLAGCVNSLINDFGMALGGNIAVLGFTAGAGSGLGALFGTGGSLGLLPFAEAVTLGRDGLLLYENGIANRAVLALGQAGFLAGCGNGLVNGFGVALGGELIADFQNFAADCTNLIATVALFGTGGVGLFLDLSYLVKAIGNPSNVSAIVRKLILVPDGMAHGIIYSCGNTGK